MRNDKVQAPLPARRRTFVSAGHPLDGAFVVVVLPDGEGEDPNLKVKRASAAEQQQQLWEKKQNFSVQ